MKIMIKVVIAQLIAAIILISVFVFSNNKEKKLIEHQIPCDYLEARYDVLIDSVADLETKAEILNRYLNMKHIEYMEVCDLVYKTKK